MLFSWMDTIIDNDSTPQNSMVSDPQQSMVPGHSLKDPSKAITSGCCDHRLGVPARFGAVSWLHKEQIMAAGKAFKRVCTRPYPAEKKRKRKTTRKDRKTETEESEHEQKP